jgi:hypothetical protein
MTRAALAMMRKWSHRELTYQIDTLTYIVLLIHPPRLKERITVETVIKLQRCHPILAASTPECEYLRIQQQGSFL